MNDFWEKVTMDESIKILWNNLPGVQVFIKDIEGRFIYVNDEAVHAYGVSSINDVIGRTDYDIFSARLAENYVKYDRDLFRDKVAQENIVELVPNRHGKVEWFLTTKVPLFCNRGELIGLMGTCQSFGLVQKNLQPYLDIAPSMEYIENNYMENFDVKRCAKLSSQSVRQFERKFKAIFQTNPQDYIIKTRIQHACNHLLKSKMGISEIATEVGFYDQSVFTHQFKKLQGITPGAYRRIHAL